MKSCLHLLDGEDWGVKKKCLTEMGDNLCGNVPVTYVDNIHLTQHVSTCHYLACTNKLDTGDALKDYYQDMIADEYQGFHDLWTTKSFGTASDKEKGEYMMETLLHYWPNLMPCTKSTRCCCHQVGLRKKKGT